jgi:hypothetical protein
MAMMQAMIVTALYEYAMNVAVGPIGKEKCRILERDASAWMRREVAGNY